MRSLYAVLYIYISCFVVHGCAVLRKYIDVCNCDVSSVVNVYLDHLKLCVVCINGQRYVCYGECNVVSNECDYPTPCLVQPLGAHGAEVFYFRGEVGFLNCDYLHVCRDCDMCTVVCVACVCAERV